MFPWVQVFQKDFLNGSEGFELFFSCEKHRCKYCFHLYQIEICPSMRLTYINHTSVCTGFDSHSEL